MKDESLVEQIGENLLELKKNPTPLIAFLRTVWGFIRRNFFWICLAILCLLGIWFIYQKMHPPVKVAPAPTNIQAQIEDQAPKVDEAQTETDEKFKGLGDRQVQGQKNIEKTRKRTSKDVDDAVENWNEGR